MRTRAVILSAAFAAYLLVLPESHPPAWVKPLIVAGFLVGPYVIGALGGWRALGTFAGVFFVLSILYEVLVWHDDPVVTGIDDIPPVAGIVLVVPLMLVPMAFGAVSRALWRKAG